MRIAHCIQALVAVLGLAAVFHQVKSQELHFNETFRGFREKRSPRRGRHFHQENRHMYTYNETIPNAGKLLTPRENQRLLNHEYRNGSGVECCPTVADMVEPEAGKNQDDILVELYRDGDYRQRFYEVSCHPSVLDKPCRFMDKKLHEQSRCVQQHTYTYALVKDVPSHRHKNKNFPTFPAQGPGGVTYTLDYISVRSGCICVVTPNKKKRNRQKNKRRQEDGLT